MAFYTINLTNGTLLTTIPDGTYNNSSTSLTLIGKNYAGYGQFLNDDLVHILENAANSTAPTPSLTGQLWWDSTNGVMKVQSGSGWKIMTGSTASSSAPTTSVKSGDLWYDTVNQQLKVYTGSGWIVVGPAFSSTEGTAGAIPETINDNGGSPHFVTTLYVNNTRVAIVSKDASFTPAAPVVSTFPTIYPGITLTNASGSLFAGSATNSQLLNNLSSSQFMRTDANTATTGRLQVNNNNGLYVGTSNVVNISQSTNDGLVTSSVSGGNLTIQANVGGTIYNVAQALGSNGAFVISNAATVGTTLNVTGNVTGGNIIFGTGQVTGTGNVTGGNVNATNSITGTVMSLTGNVQAGNVRTVGQVSATGNVTSAANISGTYFIGNGSQLTGLSSAVAVTKIVNGTSEANIGVPNGNLAVSIGGVANVVVVSTDTLFGNILSCASIAKVGANAVGNIGSSSNYFNRLFATATTALYADVAERFAADETMEPGTVVELGGVAEITKSRVELSENVFGVISTKPAYTMNGGAGEDDTHPPVAMTGRVPVKVVGRVTKGDRLVSAGNGLARSALPGEATAFNVIGRSLDNKHTPEEGIIEAIVTIK